MGDSFLIAGLDKLIRIFEKTDNAIKSGAKYLVSEQGALNRFFRGIDSLTFGITVAWKYRKLRPDIIIGHDLYAVIAAKLLSLFNRPVFIFDYVEMSYGRFRKRKPGFFGRAAIWMAERLASRSNLVLTGDTYLESDFLSRHPKANTLVIHNAVDVQAIKDSFDLKEKLGVEPSVDLMIYVGLLNSYRGLRRTIHALNFVDKNVHFVIMGHGNLLFIDELIAFAQKNGVAHRVHILPAVPFQQVVSVCRQADFAITPIDAQFGNSRRVLTNKLFEYIAANLPIVGVKGTAVGDFVDKFQIGKTAEKTDAKELAEAIASVHGNRKKYKDALINVQELYGWPQEEGKLRKAFLPLLEKL